MAGNVIYNDNELQQLMARGDEGAFRTLYNQYRDKIFNYGVQLTHFEDEADEIVQEVFLKCWLKREELAKVENLNAWLYAVARNFFVDRLRKIAREEKAFERLQREMNAITSTIEDILQHKENEQLLLNAIEQLSPQQRQVFELSRLHGLSREEIALRMGISENTVRVHLTRSLAAVRNFLIRHTDISIIALLVWKRF